MSLVYEALQKAEREKERKAGIAPVAAPAAVRPEKPPVAAHAPAPVAVTASVPVESPKSMNGFLTTLIVCVSIVALAAIVYIVMLAARNSTQPKVTGATAPAHTSETAAAPAATSPTATTEPSNTAAVPAPTAPVNSTANDSRFKLTGVMITDGRYGAVLNDRIVYDGQYIDGAIVKKVERDRVTLNVDGRDIIVRLF